MQVWVHFVTHFGEHVQVLIYYLHICGQTWAQLGVLDIYHVVEVLAVFHSEGVVVLVKGVFFAVRGFWGVLQHEQGLLAILAKFLRLFNHFSWLDN